MVSALDSRLSSLHGFKLWLGTLCCVLGGHFTLTELLRSSVQMGISDFNAGGNLVIIKHLIQGGVEILLVTLCYQNWGNVKLWPDDLLGSYREFYYLFYHCLIFPGSTMCKGSVSQCMEPSTRKQKACRLEHKSLDWCLLT